MRSDGIVAAVLALEVVKVPSYSTGTTSGWRTARASTPGKYSARWQRGWGGKNMQEGGLGNTRV